MTLGQPSRLAKLVIVLVLVLAAGAISLAAQGRVDRGFHRLERGVAEYPVDGFDGLLMGLLLGEDTTYAAGYSARGFDAVTLGMSRADVEALIGPPQKEYSLDESDPREMGARWSFSPGDTHYRCRGLLFRDGKVYEKHTEFYVD
jgi:hypothetical protein